MIQFMHGTCTARRALACYITHLFPELQRCPEEGDGDPLPYSCLEKSHRQRSLVGYRLWGSQESGTTEHTHAVCDELPGLSTRVSGINRAVPSSLHHCLFPTPFIALDRNSVTVKRERPTVSFAPAASGPPSVL